MKEYQADDELGLRDHLALDRTAMANERTMLAYVRTAIMLLVTSATLVKLFPSDRIALAAAVVLLPVAGIFAWAGGSRFLRMSKVLQRLRQ